MHLSTEFSIDSLQVSHSEKIRPFAEFEVDYIGIGRVSENVIFQQMVKRSEDERPRHEDNCT